MNVLFWFRKSEAADQKESQDPKGAIQCRISIEGREVEIGSTKVFCKKSEWNTEFQKVITLTGADRSNRRLTDISSSVLRLYDVLCTKYDYVTPEVVKDYYHSKRKFTYTFKEIFDQFSAHRGKLKDKGKITQSTLDVNENYQRHILAFTAKTKLRKPIEAEGSFLDDLFEWMIGTERSAERFARKVAAFAKQVLVWAKKQKLCPELACLEGELPGHADNHDDLDTTHLSIPQILKLSNFDFFTYVGQGIVTEHSAITLTRERDSFIFNCFTGMHHCDYSKKDFYVEEYKGGLFLKGKRKKTNIPFAIKLLDPAVQILKRYNNDLKQLPTKSNQKRNATLKLLAMYAEIPLLLTTKIARKTFCDLAINEMLMSLDDVAACLGLTSTRFIKNYGRITEQRLSKLMPDWDKLVEAA